MGSRDLEVLTLVGVHQGGEHLELVPVRRSRLGVVPEALHLFECGGVVRGGVDRLDVHDES